MRALVTGATGFIGSRFLELLLDRRWEPSVVLSRDPLRAAAVLASHISEAQAWDPPAGPPPAEAFKGIDAVFHLAGEPIAAGRWTRAKKQRIRDSRVVGTRNLVEGLSRLTNPPRVLVSASAVGFYGSRGDEELTESSAPGSDFLAEVCQEWEAAARGAEKLGIRVVLSRTGVALGHGGALPMMLRPFKLGLGGPLGNGRAWMPWIHVDDLAGLWLHAAVMPSLAGPMNSVGPTPITNRDFTGALAKQLHRPAFLPAPYFALRMALGEVANVLFASQRVLPEAATRSGYQFRYPDITAALAAILTA